MIEASAELVYQRDDLSEAASDENNRALAAALAALDSGDVSLARELIRTALAVEHREDAAIGRAKARNQDARGYTRSAAGRIETLLTGRSRSACPDDAEEPCGIVRPADRPSVGRGLTTLPCDRPAEHIYDPNDLGCLFVVEPEVQP